MELAAAGTNTSGLAIGGETPPGFKISSYQKSGNALVLLSEHGQLEQV